MGAAPLRCRHGHGLGPPSVAVGVAVAHQLGGDRVAVVAGSGRWRLMLVVRDDRRAPRRYPVSLVVLGTVAFLALLAVDQTLAFVVVPGLVLLLCVLLALGYFRRVTRRALAANLHAAAPSRPDPTG